MIFECFTICFLGNSIKTVKLILKFHSYIHDMNFLMKTLSQRAQLAFQSCSFSCLNHMRSVKFRFEANFPSLSPLQLAVYKRTNERSGNIVTAFVSYRRLMPNCCRHQNTVATLFSSTKSGN